MSQLLQNNGAVVVSLKTGSADADVTALLGCFFPFHLPTFASHSPPFLFMQRLESEDHVSDVSANIHRNNHSTHSPHS